MKRVYFVLFVTIAFRQISYCQTSNKVDSALWLLTKADVKYGCLDTFFNADYLYLEDSMLRDFFLQIDKTGHYGLGNGTKSEIFFELLKKAKNDSNIICALPFYRLIDPRANEVYEKNCKVSSMIFPYMCYCDELPVRYIYLFYLHFTQIKNIKLKRGEVISRIELQKLGYENKNSLNTDDYNKLYDLYSKWLKNYKDYKVVKSNPLIETEFNWNIQIRKIPLCSKLSRRPKSHN